MSRSVSMQYRPSYPLLAATLVAMIAGCGGPSNESGHVAASRVGALSDVPAPRVSFDRDMIEACGPHDGHVGLSELARLPYLQRVDTESARVLWTASHTEGYRVRVETPDGEQVGTFDAALDTGAHPEDAYQHETRVDGLEPATTYCYTVEGPDGDMFGPAALRTAPPADSDAPVAFVAFGDSGYVGPDQDAVFSQVKMVPHDLMLSTGDVAYEAGRQAELERGFFGAYEETLSSVPAFPISGNHDYSTRAAAPFLEAFDLPDNAPEAFRERYYSFEWGPVHFVGLDTEQLDETQLAWLEADLDANELPWIVAYMHRGPYSSGKHGSYGTARSRVSPLLEAHGAQLVLSGHDHHYERTKSIGGITYIVTGAGGRGTRKVGSSSFTAFSEDVLHFVYVRVEGDTMRVYAIDGTGKEFDFVRIDRDGG